MILGIRVFLHGLVPPWASESLKKQKTKPLEGQSRFDDSEDLFSVFEELSSLR